MPWSIADSALQEAVRELLYQKLRALGGSGGVIAIDRGGRIVTEFSTEGMFRGARDSSGLRQIDIY